MPLVASIALLLAAGCEDPQLPVRDEPLIYVVLNQRAQAGSPPGQYGFVLETGSIAEPRYRDADRFTMQRQRDGKPFLWRPTGRTGPTSGDYAGMGMNLGNYYLPDSPSSDGRLGADSIASGERYELTVETRGQVLRGAVTVPGTAVLSAAAVPGGTRVSWPRVAGAGGYSVEARGLTTAALQSDTAFVFSRQGSSPVTVTVKALDPQLFAFQTDERLERAGLEQGYGVFGAITTASIIIP